VSVILHGEAKSVVVAVSVNVSDFMRNYVNLLKVHAGGTAVDVECFGGNLWAMRGEASSGGQG
jgi:hypothetical protein